MMGLAWALATVDKVFAPWYTYGSRIETRWRDNACSAGVSLYWHRPTRVEREDKSFSKMLSAPTGLVRG